MKPYQRILSFFFAFLSGTSSARDAAPPSTPKVETAGVVLYQPNAVVQQRLSSVEELAAYIKQLQAVLGESLQDNTVAETLDVVVVVKPGRKVRVWFVSSLPKAPDRSTLARKLQSLAAPTLKDGPVAFAVSLNLAGAQRKAGAAGFSPPMPEEWRKAAKDSHQPLSVPDGIVERIWKD